MARRAPDGVEHRVRAARTARSVPGVYRARVVEVAVPTRAVDRAPPRHVVRLGEDDGRAALLVDGVVQSISPRDADARGGYWLAMLPDVKPRSALILGLAGGTLAGLLVRRFGEGMRMVGVDDDAEVLSVAREAGWLEQPGLEVAHEDAFAYLRHIDERFDYVAIDLYRGPRFQGHSLTRPMLRMVEAALQPRGHLVVNLFLDRWTVERMNRIRCVFDIERHQRVESNMIVHARKRGRV